MNNVFTASLAVLYDESPYNFSRIHAFCINRSGANATTVKRVKPKRNTGVFDAFIVFLISRITYSSYSVLFFFCSRSRSFVILFLDEVR